jgi:DNA-directed RNA polymerase subunit RPC12/RpoP
MRIPDEINTRVRQQVRCPYCQAEFNESCSKDIFQGKSEIKQVVQCPDCLRLTSIIFRSKI